MAIGKDWVTQAAHEVLGLSFNEPAPTLEDVVLIILKHCPFKFDVAYEEVREKPLLICIDCKRTESCAGAMARVFNHGRCICGGYFKVFRA